MKRTPRNRLGKRGVKRVRSLPRAWTNRSVLRFAGRDDPVEKIAKVTVKPGSSAKVDFVISD